MKTQLLKPLLKFVMALIIFASFIQVVNAQTDTEFWFAAPEVSSGGGNFDKPIMLRITAASLASTVTIQQPANSGFTPQVVSVPANTLASFDLTPWIASIENSPANTANNWGLLITATTPVSIYYEVVSAYCNCNPEIFALKGSNALGLKFFTPFQNYLSNAGYSPTPYSAFDIVATQDNTTITITPTKNLVGHSAGIPYTVTLQRGQTYSGVAASQLASEHPSGTKIESNRPIAVTLKDDLLGGTPYGGCADLMGDQLIPVNKVGRRYIVLRGYLNGGVEKAFVNATVDNTQITVDGVPVATINAGGVYVVTFSNPSVLVEASNDIYLLHMSGFGCEVAGAVLPPLDCSGSNQIGIARSTTESFYLNLLVRNGSQGNFLFNNATGVINASSFFVVPNTGNAWVAAQISLSTSQLAAGGSALVSNTSDVFQLGIIHGGSSSGTRYGYFSNFSTVNVIASTTPSICNGQNIQLSANTIPGASYSWSGPNSFTSTFQNPTISSASSVNSGTYNVLASVSGCSGTSSATTAVYPYPTVSASSNSPVLAGGTVNLSGSGATTYSWAGPNSFSSTLQNPSIANAQSNASGTYTVTGTSNGCSSNATTSVTVNTPASSLNFDGNSDNVTVSGINIANQSFTFECWAQATASNRDNIVAGQGPASPNNGLHIGFRSNNVFTFAFYANDLNTATQYPDNNWHHWACVYSTSASGRTRSIYRDGVLVAQDNPSADFQGSGTFYIGQHSWGANFLGNIDEVRIWNRALCQGEIQNNMNCELNSGGQTGLLALYHSNQGYVNANNSGVTTLTDASGNGRNGTLQNFSLNGTTSNWSSPGGVTTGTSCSAFIPPTITASSSSPLTVGGSLNLTSTGGFASYLWTGPNSFTSTGQNPTISGVTSASAGTYTVTGTASNGCAATATTTVVVNTPATGLNFGGSATNNYVSISTNSNIPVGNSNYTLEAWIKPAVHGNNGIIGWGNYGTTNQTNVLRLGSGNVLINYWWGNDLVVNTGNLADGNWHHVAATFDGTTRKIYVDGNLSGQDNPTGHNVPNASNLRIGAACEIYSTTGTGVCEGERFNGAMDEVRIWNRALCQGEIQNNKDCELNPSGQTGLVALYHFNQGNVNANNSSVTTLTDAAGTNNGTLVNFALNGSTSNWVAGNANGTCTAFIQPTITASSNSPVNTGGTLNLTSSSGFSTYAWTGPNGFTSTLQNPSVSNITMAAAGTYTVKGLTSSNCGATSTTYVTIRLDSDGDGIADATDADDDNDGITDASECNKSNFYWSNPPTVSGYTATGTINGIGYTYTSSQPVTTTTSMFANSNFPASYNVPNSNPTIQNIYVTSNTLTFASPMTNPVLVFASIGQGGLRVPITFSSPVQVVWSQNVTVNSSTQITGEEGYAIVRMMGTFTSISFNYQAQENYCNFAFGADFQTCGDSDNDGKPDYLDTDADNDGCPDAIEGSMHFALSQTSGGMLTGGVGASGIPTLAGSGQEVGTSQTYIANCFCQPGVDQTAPSVSTKNITVNLNASGTATIAASAVDNGSTDACGIKTLNVSPSSFTCTNIGANTVTLTVTDNNNNVSTGTAIVTVADVTAPTALAKNVTVNLDAGGNASITASQVNNNSTDNCAVAAVSVSPSSFTCADANATTSAQSTKALLFDGADDYLITNNAIVHGSNFTYEAWVNITSSDDWDGIFTTLSPDNNHLSQFVMNSAGRLRFEIKGANGDNTRKIYDGSTDIRGAWHHVAATYDGTNLRLFVDGVEEVIAAKYDDDVVGALSINKRFLMGSERNYGPRLSGKIDEIRMWNITKTAAQIAAGKNITLIGNESGLIGYWPIEEGSGSTTADLVSGNTFAMMNMNATTAWVQGNVSVLPQRGVYVTLTVSDASNNTSTVRSIVTVNDVTPPTVTCHADTVTLQSNGSVTISANDLVTSSSDNCLVASITASQTTFTNTNVGNNTVVLTATDASGNISRCTTNVYVIEPAPHAICKNATVYLNASGSASITVTDVDNGSYSLVGLSSRTVSKSTFDCSNVGTNSVWLVVTSNFGKKDSCQATVTVIDNTAPTVNTRNITVSLNSGGTATISASQVDTGSTDACGIASRSVSPNSFTCANVGANTVTLTVTDNNGNSSTGTATVTVIDAAAPTVVTQNVTVYLDATGNAALTTAQVNNGSSDNCGIASMSVSPSSFTCTNVATTTPVTQTLVSDNTWRISTTSTVSGLCNTGTWSGVSTLPAASTYTVSPTFINYATYLMPGTQGIYLVGDVKYVRKTFTLTSINDIKATLMASVDNAIQIFVNGVAVAFEKDLDAANFNDANVSRVVLNSTGANINGGTGYQNFDNITSTNASSLFVVGTNEIVLAVANCASPDAGTFSFKAIIEYKQINNQSATLTVTDVNGNTASAQAQVTVIDNIAPTVNTQNVTVQLNASGAASITTAQINNGSTDNCSIASYSLSKTSFNCSNVGANTVTLTVTDVNGNSNTGTATVTVQDNIAPTVNTQNVTVQLNASGAASITTAQINNGSTDNCSIASYSLDKTSFTCSNVGSNTVTLTVTDVNGNSSTGTATVTVQDNIAPTVNTQNVTVQLNASGAASITTAQINNGSTDNCSIASYSLDKTSFTCSNIGANTVTLTVTDVNGNSNTGTATVTVQDNIAPTVNTQNVTVQLNASGSASITASQVNNGSTDACGIKSISVSPSTFTCSNVSGASGAANNYAADLTHGDDYIVIGNVTPAGNSYTKEAWVNMSSNSCENIVSSNQNPFWITGGKLSAGQNNNYSALQDPATFALNVWTHVAVTYDAPSNTMKLYRNGVLVATNTNAPVNSGGTNAIGKHYAGGCNFGGKVDEVRIWNYALSITDIQNNKNKTLVGNETGLVAYYPLENGPAGTSATDATGHGNNGTFVNINSSQVWVSGATPVIPTTSGNTVTLTVEDNNGNTSTGTATVTVQDNIAPTVNTQNVTVQLNASGAASITTAQINNGSTDNCSIASYSLNKTSFNCSNVGANTVTLTVTDVNGNSNTGTATVTVQDNIAPTAISQNVDIYLNASGAASTSTSAVDNGSYDNCSIASLSLSKTNFDCSNVGENTDTLTVTDVNGNVTKTTATVTVHDDIAPTAIAQNVDIYLNASGAASTSTTAVDNGSYDNCSIASLSLSKTNFDCSNVGDNTDTLTVTDVNGNVTKTTATVSVHDTISPTVVTRNVTIQLNASGSASITTSQINNGSNDNCSIASYSLSKTSFNCSNVGSNTVILTVTDVNGNSSIRTATVTVQDNIAPTVIAKNVTVTLSGGAASVTAAQVNNGSYDNCTIASLSVSPNSFTCSNIGDNTVTLTVTDVNGNVSTTTSTVSVVGAIPTASIAQSLQPGLTQGGAIILTASSPTAVSYSWTGGPANAVYNVYASGTYTVTVTNSYGCTANASSVVSYVASNLLSSYTIIGKKEAELKDHSTVYNGGVGVTTAGGEAEFEDYSNVTASGTFVRSPKIEVKSNSNVTTRVISALPTSILPAFLYNPYCSSNCSHSHHNSCCGSSCTNNHHNSCSNGSNKNVGQNATVTITDSVMGQVVIGKNAIVTFTSPRIYIKGLEVNEGATVIFSQCAVVRICNHVNLQKRVNFNTTNSSIVSMYVEKKFDVDEGSTVVANVYALDEIKANGKSTAPTVMRGLFIGDEVEAEKYVSFYWNTNTICTNNNYKSEFIANESGLIKDYFDADIYPNPALTTFNVRLFSSSTEPFTVEVYDMTGKLIDSARVSETSLNEDMGSNYRDGMYIIRITQGENTKTTRLVKVTK